MGLCEDLKQLGYSEAYALGYEAYVEGHMDATPARSGPTRAGFVWVRDPSVKGGGFWRKARPSKGGLGGTIAKGAGAVLAAGAVGAAAAVGHHAHQKAKYKDLESRLFSGNRGNAKGAGDKKAMERVMYGAHGGPQNEHERKLRGKAVGRLVAATAITAGAAVGAKTIADRPKR